MPLKIDETALDGVAEKDKGRVLDKIEWLWENRVAVTHHYAYDSNPDELIVRIVGTRDDIYREAAKG